MGDPAQVLVVMRDVLLEHMNKGLGEYRVQRAIYIGNESGRMIGDEQIMNANDVPGGLLLRMQSGDEYCLKLTI